MPKNIAFGILSIIALNLAPTIANANVYGTNHHGGLVLDCTAPIFFEESPGKDAKVAVLEKFSFTASDNTHDESIKVWVNTVPVDIKITPQRSGRLTVEATLPQPITQGRAWIKVTALSHDGCDELHTWNVYTGN